MGKLLSLFNKEKHTNTLKTETFFLHEIQRKFV